MSKIILILYFLVIVAAVLTFEAAQFEENDMTDVQLPRAKRGWLCWNFMRSKCCDRKNYCSAFGCWMTACGACC